MKRGAAAARSCLRKAAGVAGAAATLDFEGSAVILVGPYSQSGGKADVYLDGRKSGEINAWIPERTNDNALWHTYGLKPGRHTLRIVTRPDADPRSKGKRIEITAVLTFKAWAKSISLGTSRRRLNKESVGTLKARASPGSRPLHERFSRQSRSFRTGFPIAQAPRDHAQGFAVPPFGAKHLICWYYQVIEAAPN